MISGIKETAFELPNQTAFYKGKVRDVYSVGDKLVMVATDRISAFDVVMTKAIPYKGQVLNQTAAFFFELTKKAKCDRIVAVGCTHYVDDLPEILEMLPNTIIKIHFSPEVHSNANVDWLVMRSWGELPALLGLDI
jgi:phosphoribosylaminoimidazole-succinocarboxamide synthase